MARIKPGSLAGSAVPLWTQMDVRVPRTSRRKRKERIQPQEILAWFNLAQTLAKDESILGGIVNAIARKSREGDIAEQRKQDATQLRQQELDAMDRQQQMRGVDPRVAQQVTQTMTGVPPASSAFADLREPGQVPMQPQAVTPEMLQQVAAAQGPQQQLAVAQPPPQMAQPVVTPAQMPGRIAAQTPQREAREPASFEEAAQILQQQDAARAKQRAAAFAKQKAYTYADLLAMAAGAEDGEQLRHVMSMVPQVMSQDPSFAPRSLSDLLFGGGGAAEADVSRSLVEAFLKRQGKLRSPEERVERAARARKTLGAAQAKEATTPGKIEETAASTALKWSQVDLNKAKKDLTSAREAKVDAERKRLEGYRRRTGRGFLGKSGNDAVAEYGVYLGALKAAKGNVGAIFNDENKVALIPERFQVKDDQGNVVGIMDIDEAHGAAMTAVGRKGRAQVKDQRKFYVDQMKPPKAPGETAAFNRRKSVRSTVEKALIAFNDNAAIAKQKTTSQTYGKTDIEQARLKVDSLKRRLERAVAQAAEEGLVFEIAPGAQEGQLDVKLKKTTPANIVEVGGEKFTVKD